MPLNKGISAMLGQLALTVPGMVLCVWGWLFTDPILAKGAA